MSRDSWYRNEAWDPAIEAAFFEKLARARSQRDQYLVIQALTLSDKEPEVALRLVDTYFETKSGDFENMRALLARAQAYEKLDDLPRAIECYKDVLAREAEFPNHLSGTSLTLPYLIACREVTEEYDFAIELLRKSTDDLAFPIAHFHWHASLALILNDQGHREEAREHARSSVKIAKIRRSGFRYHQELGLVGEEQKNIVRKMHRLANCLA